MFNSPTICVAMIVKNESAIIRRCLESAFPYAHRWCIVDTGSTDNTQDVINDVAREWSIPGTLIEEPWVNFAWNRSSLLQHARKMDCDYLLLFDADMELHVDGDALEHLTEPGYYLRQGGDFAWWMPYLVRSDVRCHYVGATHEFLSIEDDVVFSKLGGLWIDHHGDGGTRPEKFERDLNLLNAEYELGSAGECFDRTIFYLANTHKDMGNHDEALKLYRERVALGGWPEEIYWAKYMVASITGKLEDFLAAWHFRPERTEALHDAMVILNNSEAQSAAYLIGRERLKSPPPDDLLFVQEWINNWGLEFQFALAAWWSGHADEAKHVFENLLTRELSDETRELVERNLTFC